MVSSDIETTFAVISGFSCVCNESLSANKHFAVFADLRSQVSVRLEQRRQWNYSKKLKIYCRSVQQLRIVNGGKNHSLSC